MAKQTGIIALRGKIKGQSYYGSKVGGDLVRTINEGMSARVKTGKEYANTRKNNSEFGSCGDFAGALIKPFTLRWRFILDSIATGKMVKKLKELLIQDSVGAWGQRQIDSDSFGEIRAAFNSFSKNEMIPDLVNALTDNVVYDASNNQISIAAIPQLSVATAQELLALGANYFYTKVYAFTVNAPRFDDNTMKYVKSLPLITELTGMSTGDDINGVAVTDLFADNKVVCNLNPISTGEDLGAMVVVFLPARKVGSSINILQQYCSAYMVEVTADPGE